ncbi:MAG: TrgA family protein [Ruegeria sp.]|uniref:TrgA family protein n=1 Tax=Ruegeria sp. ANG-S4 TaxID=1577904 RepID=UPI00057EA854|nr:TrgA family protein [Ruegeria sp. ANG-S4]KIC44244.1 tellurium resistance protein [Ruegeria sp. ANG-S4]
MPTAARLVASTCLLVVAFLVSSMIMANGEEGKSYGYFPFVNMALGVACGWVIMGKRAGRGWTAGLNNGLTGVAALVFWGLFVQGTYEMVQQAMRNRYGGPFEAVIAIFELGVGFASQLAASEIILTLIVGAIVTGLLTEIAARRWN